MDYFDELEEILIMADIGVDTVVKFVNLLMVDSNYFDKDFLCYLSTILQKHS